MIKREVRTTLRKTPRRIPLQTPLQPRTRIQVVQPVRRQNPPRHTQRGQNLRIDRDRRIEEQLPTHLHNRHPTAKLDTQNPLRKIKRVQLCHAHPHNSSTTRDGDVEIDTSDQNHPIVSMDRRRRRPAEAAIWLELLALHAQAQVGGEWDCMVLDVWATPTASSDTHR
jgi:hypothetical protein